MEIQLTQKRSSGVERHIEVSIPVEAVRAAEEKATRRYASQVRLPGFRPGKVPAQVVRKKFHDEIRQAALEALVRDAYQKAITDENLEVASQPHVHDVKFEEGKPLTFELHLEVRPTLELARTNGFRVQRTPRVVTDEHVEEQLTQMRDQKATWQPIDERPAEGDMVRVQLATTDESGALPEGKEYSIVLGSGQAIAGIEELIMEAKPGESVERPVRWPEDFPDEAQRGKTKTVRVTLVDAKRKALPELDDTFAREVGDFDSLDALKKTVRDDLTESARREEESEVRQRLVDEIVQANPFDVPRSWVQQLVQRYAEAYQVPEEHFETFSKEFSNVAERQVRRDLVIETLGKREGLEATEKDIDDRVAEQAERRGANPAQVYASLEKSGRLKDVERSITEEKVFSWLIDRNTIE
jgi:trigger factor